MTEIEPSKFRLEWATPSFSNILEHSLIYKQVKVIFSGPEEKYFIIFLRLQFIGFPYIQDPSSPSLLTYGENKLKIPNMLKADLNCSGRYQPLKQRFEFLLDKLEPGTRYQVRLKARNHHGWGETSQPITFKTSQFIGERKFYVSTFWQCLKTHHISGQPPQESQILPLSEGNRCQTSALLISWLLAIANFAWCM